MTSSSAQSSAFWILCPAPRSSTSRPASTPFHPVRRIDEIVELLSSGKSLQYNVVIPEGLTSAMIMRLLAESDWGRPKTPPAAQG